MIPKEFSDRFNEISSIVIGANMMLNSYIPQAKMQQLKTSYLEKLIQFIIDLDSFSQSLSQEDNLKVLSFLHKLAELKQSAEQKKWQSQLELSILVFKISNLKYEIELLQ
ncbi:hypothetical protein J4405_00320 [Candidatus Woesearchaeota archaeon]|nr:hypothetical protein [Candidatus Woesearchaeota archaeon]